MGNKNICITTVILEYTKNITKLKLYFFFGCK